MEPIHEIRYWALATLASDEIVPGSEAIRDSLMGWVQEHPGALRPDAAAFLLTNARSMYLVPIQGAGFLSPAALPPQSTEYLKQLVDTPDLIDTLSRVERDDDLISALQDDLKFLLDRALERFDDSGEAVTGHQMLRIIDASWESLRAWFF